MIKRKDKFLIFLLLLILFLCISAVSAVDSFSNDENLTLEDRDCDDAVGMVNEEIASNDPVLQAKKPMSFSDLSNKVWQSSKITLDSDVVYQSGDSVSDGILITGTKVIDGKGHTINAKGKTRIFKVASGCKLTLKNVNIVNGRMSGNHGGAILNSGKIVLNKCNFISCKVTGSKANGGAISGSGSGTISHCNFSKCSAGYMGGAANVNKNKFNYCTFTNNVARFGGAVAGTVYLYNSDFKNCKSTAPHNYDGGGAGTGEFPRVESCTFTNCKSKGFGGALRGTTNSYNSKFIDCASKQGGAIRGKGNTIGCTFIKCSASTQGGAIYTQNARINKCTFIQCTAPQKSSKVIFKGIDVKITNCKFISKCVKPKLTANNLNQYYNSPKAFKVKLKGYDGKIAKGEHVKFYINGKYLKDIKTNSKGIASIKVNNNPGKYKITAKYDSAKLTKTLSVKHVLSLDNVEVNKSGAGLELSASVKEGKTSLKNKKVTFIFNGNKYIGKTNSNGIAKVKVDDSVLKSLTAGSKVSYQATYLKDTVKKTATVKE